MLNLRLQNQEHSEMENRLACRGRKLVMTLMLIVLALVVPQRANAEDGTYVDRSYNYQVMLNGSNTIRIQVPVFDEEGADCWVANGNLFVKWTDDDGEHEQILFHWRWDNMSEEDHDDHDNDLDYLTCCFLTNMPGEFEVTQGNSSSRFTLTIEKGVMRRTIHENSDGNTYTAYAVWRLPYNLLGKTLKMRWEVTRDGTSRYHENVSGLNSSEITYGNETDQAMMSVTVRYYCSQLKQLFSRTVMVKFDMGKVYGLDEDIVPQFTLGSSKYPVVTSLSLSSLSTQFAPLAEASISDVLAVFVGDECRGIYTLDDLLLSGAASLNVFGRVTGETFMLKYYRPTTKQVFTFSTPIKVDEL